MILVPEINREHYDKYIACMTTSGEFWICKYYSNGYNWADADVLYVPSRHPDSVFTGYRYKVPMLFLLSDEELIEHVVLEVI
jgi:hypothetical protein